jgi:hypothetical protein
VLRLARLGGQVGWPLYHWPLLRRLWLGGERRLRPGRGVCGEGHRRRVLRRRLSVDLGGVGVVAAGIATVGVGWLPRAVRSAPWRRRRWHHRWHAGGCMEMRKPVGRGLLGLPLLLLLLWPRGLGPLLLLLELLLLLWLLLL